MKNRIFAGMFALMFCMGAFLFPTSVFAQTDKDTTPPTLTAKLEDGTLHVETKDEESGLQAVYVDNNRINSLVDGKASVILKDYAGNNKQVSIYAVDFAGNRCDPVKIDNPYYSAPASLPAASQPAASQPASAPAAPKPQTPPASSQPASSSAPPASSSQPTTTEAPTSPAPLTPEGQGTVIDQATDEDGKEFYTVMTPEGNVFYLVIDRQRGTENVYFLNAVTEADLMALAEKDKNGQTAIPTPEPQPQPTSEPNSEPESQPEQETPAKENNMGTMLVIIFAAAIAGGAGYYFKIVKPKQQAAMEDEFEDDEYEDDQPEYEDPGQDEGDGFYDGSEPENFVSDESGPDSEDESID